MRAARKSAVEFDRTYFSADRNEFLDPDRFRELLSRLGLPDRQRAALAERHKSNPNRALHDLQRFGRAKQHEQHRGFNRRQLLDEFCPEGDELSPIDNYVVAGKFKNGTAINFKGAFKASGPLPFKFFVVRESAFERHGLSAG